jgi:hypothetical protein
MSVRPIELALRSVLAAVAAAVAFLAVHLASYLGNLDAMAAALSKWWAFASNPAPGMSSLVNELMVLSLYQGHNYHGFLAWSICAFLLAFAGLIVLRQRSLRVTLLCVFCVSAFFAACFFVYKRPAQSTMFESTMLFLFTLSAVLLTVVGDWRPARLFIVGSCIAWAVAALATFDFAWNYRLVAGSEARSRIKWDAFEQTCRMAHGRPIEVVFPDNTFHHEGAFELVLKGASDFPNWTITMGEKTIIERYCPGLTFRIGERSGIGVRPQAPYGGDRIVAWFDRAEIWSLTTYFEELDNAVTRPGVVRRQWQVPTRGGERYLTMNVATLPPLDVRERMRRDNIRP